MSTGVRLQLLVFLVITALGVSYAGARYAGLTHLFGDETYTVTVELAESGGIFESAEVTYRGVSVGRVAELRLSADGVAARLEIEGDTRPIPADTLAVVENRSAIGEQYIDLQPRRDGAPYLADGARVPREDTRTPVSTTELLSNLDSLVRSVDKEELTIVVDELGAAFAGTGADLGRIIESGNALVDTADASLAQTIRLIEDGTTVLRTQVDSGAHIQSFAADLADLSEALVDADTDLRTVIDEGRVTAAQLDGLIGDIEDDVPLLLANLVTTGQIVRERLDGLRQALIVYPYVVRGGFTVADQDPVTGHYTTHFGLQLALGPASCREGYEDTNRRVPGDESRAPMNTDARCADEDTTHRGAQNAPEPGSTNGDVGTYERGAPARIGTLGGQQRVMGEESWRWLLMGPLTK